MNRIEYWNVIWAENMLCIFEPMIESTVFRVSVFFWGPYCATSVFLVASLSSHWMRFQSLAQSVTQDSFSPTQPVWSQNKWEYITVHLQVFFTLMCPTFDWKKNNKKTKQCSGIISSSNVNFKMEADSGQTLRRGNSSNLRSCWKSWAS